MLFWLAILMRYQWVSRLSGIVLAGLSGAAFAFTENILYYGRVYRYAARTFGEVPPLEALQDLFFLRGVMTFFGHPLFTAMTGIGLAVALRSKSKIVRVVAPLAGFCAAAFLHMAFNTTATLVSGPSLLFIYSAWRIPLVIGLIIFVVRQLFREGRLIRERLGDYVRLGWLPESDPEALSRLRTRLRALWHAVFLGPDAFLATIRMQRAVTELAYLRDAMTRGLVDDTGLARETRRARQDPRGTRPGHRRSRRAARPTRRSGARPAPIPAYAPPASPAPPASAATTRPRAFPAPTGCRRAAAAAFRWGRLLPSTQRSTPTGNRPGE